MRKLAAVAVAVILCLTGCASVQMNPQMGEAVTHAPLEASIGFGHVVIPENSQLVGANIDGKPAYCTQFAAYFVPGESRSVCLSDSNRDGFFDRYYVMGTISSAVYPAHVPYTVTEARAAGADGPSVADLARCNYQAYAGSMYSFGLLARSINEANLRSLCLQSAAFDHSKP